MDQTACCYNVTSSETSLYKIIWFWLRVYMKLSALTQETITKIVWHYAAMKEDSKLYFLESKRRFNVKSQSTESDMSCTTKQQFSICRNGVNQFNQGTVVPLQECRKGSRSRLTNWWRQVKTVTSMAKRVFVYVFAIMSWVEQLNEPSNLPTFWLLSTSLRCLWV